MSGHTLAFKVVGEKRDPLTKHVVPYDEEHVRVFEHLPREPYVERDRYPDPPGSVMQDGGHYRHLSYRYVQPDGTEGFTDEELRQMGVDMEGCEHCRRDGEMIDNRRAPGS